MPSPVKIGDILRDLLNLSGIKSKKAPTVKLIMEVAGVVVESTIETFIEFVKHFPLATTFVITVEEPEIKTNREFQSKAFRITL